MPKRFLGFDCANKTLAYSYLDIDTHIYSKISILSQSMEELLELYCGKELYFGKKNGKENHKLNWPLIRLNLQDPEFLSEVLFIIECLNMFVSNFLSYICLGVVDVLEGIKVDDTTDVQRTRALWNFLITSPVANITGNVIIEHQPNKIGSKTNSKSTAVSHQLAFYYIKLPVIMIDPRLKNNLTLSDDLRFEDFKTREESKLKDPKAARYAARKKHSKISFLYLVKVFGLEHLIVGISRSVLDDLADSTMQILAYLVENKLFI